MNSVIGSPVFTRVYPDIRAIRLVDESLYVIGSSDEERSRHAEVLEDLFTEVTFAHVISSNDNQATIRIGETEISVHLRSSRSISRFLRMNQYEAVYLDITGLDHSVWAPLTRGIRGTGIRSFSVYVEPGDYRFSEDPTEATIFDLSDRIGGIAPLPGFASFRGSQEEDYLFVPILGFEGARFTYALEAVQPDRRRIFPVIGAPGFRPEYPFYSYHGNGVPLEETKGWQNVRFAPANCPFALYHLLAGLSNENRGSFMKIAMIGTKPHALGAVLYCLDHPGTTELIYDHPIRTPQRTSGVSRTCLYELSMLPATASGT